MKHMILATLALLALATPLSAGDAIDFSRADSPAALAALAAKGDLVKLYLFPLELGGQEIPPNEVWVTPEAAQKATEVTQAIIAKLQEGVVDKMSVEPAYKGKSRVPSRIAYHTSHSTTGKTFDWVVEVW